MCVLITALIYTTQSFYCIQISYLYSPPPPPPPPPPTEVGWFEVEETKNHNIYVSGLPHDITLEEFEEMMSKYGIIMEDEEGGCGFLIN